MGSFYVFLILLVVVPICGALIAFAVISYILQAKGLYTIAKRRGFQAPWLAWIPYASSWLMGAVADDYCFKAEKKETSYRKIILGTYIATGVWSSVSELFVELFKDSGSLAGLGVALPLCLGMVAVAVVCTVFQYIALFKIYYSCKPSKATPYLLLSIFLGVTLPFLLYSVRNSDKGIPADVLEQPVHFQNENSGTEV